MRKLLSFIFLACFLYSCSSAGQMKSDTDASDDDSADNTPAEESVAPWYDHTNKAYSDSLDFTGLGMALAADSSEAMEVSMTQARENLEYAIDSYAEDIRRGLSESESDNELNSGSFLLSLRAAVNGLEFSDGNMTIAIEYSARDNGSVIAYSMVSVPKEMAIDMLASAVENDTFSRSLRDSSEK